MMGLHCPTIGLVNMAGIINGARASDLGGAYCSKI